MWYDSTLAPIITKYPPGLGTNKDFYKQKMNTKTSRTTFSIERASVEESVKTALKELRIKTSTHTLPIWSSEIE